MVTRGRTSDQKTNKQKKKCCDPPSYFVPWATAYVTYATGSCIFCLMMCQMFSICERSGLQAGQFSTRTLLL